MNTQKNLVNPNHAIIFGGWHTPGEVYDNRSPGTYRIAHVCRNLGWEIETIDYIYHWGENELLDLLTRIINKKNSKWIGISYNWLLSFSNELKNLILKIKNRYPHIKFIVGGQAPYNIDLDCDWYIFGYAEDAIKAVLDFEYSNGPKPKCEKIFNGLYIDAIRDYPAIYSKKYEITYVENDFMNSQDVVSLELARGCKFKCNFCNYPFIGFREDTSTDEESLYRELNENYQRWGIKTYVIVDDTYNDRIEKIIKLRNVVKRLDFEIDFSAFIRTDLLATNPDTIKILAESRIWMHYYGIETFNHSSGKIIGKGMDPNRIKDTLLNTKDYMLSNITAYRGSIGLIAGLPKETIDSLEDTYKWCNDYWKDQHWLFWPLVITKSQNSLSAFGKDLKKFGYQECTEPVENNLHIFNHKNDNNIVIWKNDITNFIDMVKWCDKKAATTVIPLDNFAITSYIRKFGIKRSLKFKTNTISRYSQSHFVKAASFRIQQYKLLKINSYAENTFGVKKGHGL